MRGTWSTEEDVALTNAVAMHGAKNWKKISNQVPGRTDVQCLHRWQKVLNPDLVKGPWSTEEDNLLRELINVYGPKKWSLIANHLPGRIGKQCRERWANHLAPGISKGNWQPWEDDLIIKLQKEHGNKWSEFTKLIPGRTDNAIKNRFNSTIQKMQKEKFVTEIRSNNGNVSEDYSSFESEEYNSEESSQDLSYDEEDIDHASRFKSPLKKVSHPYTAIEVENGSMRSSGMKQKRTLTESTKNTPNKRPKIDAMDVVPHHLVTKPFHLDFRIEEIRLSNEKCQLGMKLLQSNQILNINLIAKVRELSPLKRPNTPTTL